jgi:hypothetical protein
MDAPYYGDIFTAIAPAMGEGPAPEMFHVHFNKDPRAILSKPVTEVARFAIKEGKTQEEFGPLAEKLLSLIEKAGGDLVWGQTVEKENEYVALLGWKSVEVGLLYLSKSHCPEELIVAGIQSRIISTPSGNRRIMRKLKL